MSALAHRLIVICQSARQVGQQGLQWREFRTISATTPSSVSPTPGQRCEVCFAEAALQQTRVGQSCQGQACLHQGSAHSSFEDKIPFQRLDPFKTSPRNPAQFWWKTRKARKGPWYEVPWSLTVFATAPHSILKEAANSNSNRNSDHRPTYVDLILCFS